MKYTVREQEECPGSCWKGGLILTPLSGLEGRSEAEVEVAVSAAAEGCS